MNQQAATYFQPLLARLGRLAALPVEARRAVESWPSSGHTVGKRRALPAAAGCRLLVSGVVASCPPASDGRLQIFALHVPGDFIDLPHIRHCSGQGAARALGEAKILDIPTDAILASAAAHPALAQALLALVGVEVATSRERLRTVAHCDARMRLAHLLCELALRMAAVLPGDVGAFALPMTQEQLGAVLGLTAIHINRTLRGLQDEGLITYSIGHVRVHDMTRLADVGGFDPAYLDGGV